MYEELDFGSLQVKEVPVTLTNGSKWTLKEATGKAATDHRNAIMACTVWGPDGRAVGLKDLASVEARFVAACLFDASGRNPTPQMVQSEPARVQKALYEKLKELSEFGENTIAISDLEDALKRSDSPVSLEVFTEWAKALPDEHQSLARAFKEPSLKNS